MKKKNKSKLKQKLANIKNNQPYKDLFKLGLEKMLNEKLSDEEVDDMDMILSGLSKEDRDEY
ncbi:MAG: hypothetical protein ACK44N_03520 [Bacteroidota bacterium]